MEAKKHYRKVPPYMTKTGVQIGLLYQEPFEARMSRDEHAWQKTFLAQKIEDVNKPYIVIDMTIVIICIIAFAGIIIGALYGLL